MKDCRYNRRRRSLMAVYSQKVVCKATSGARSHLCRAITGVYHHDAAFSCGVGVHRLRQALATTYSRKTTWCRPRSRNRKRHSWSNLNSKQADTLFLPTIIDGEGTSRKYHYYVNIFRRLLSTCSQYFSGSILCPLSRQSTGIKLRFSFMLCLFLDIKK